MGEKKSRTDIVHLMCYMIYTQWFRRLMYAVDWALIRAKTILSTWPGFTEDKAIKPRIWLLSGFLYFSLLLWCIFRVIETGRYSVKNSHNSFHLTIFVLLFPDLYQSQHTQTLCSCTQIPPTLPGRHRPQRRTFSSAKAITPVSAFHYFHKPFTL